MEAFNTFEKVKFYHEFNLGRKIAFHTLLSKTILFIKVDFKDAPIGTKYTEFAYDALKSYLSGSDASEVMANIAAADHFLNEFLKENQKNAEAYGVKFRYEHYNILKLLPWAIPHIEDVVKTTPMKELKKFFEDLNVDYSKEEYDSLALREGVSDAYGHLALRFRLEEESMLQSDPARIMHYMKASCLFNGDTNDDQTIVTQLNCRASLYEPKDPTKYYKNRVRDLLKKSNEAFLTSDDILAFEWFVVDWYGLADHYLKNDSEHAHLAVHILEALMYVFESSFAEHKISMLRILDCAFTSDLLYDYEEIAMLYIEALKYYEPKDFDLALKRFKKLESLNRPQLFVDLPRLVKKMEKYAKRQFKSV